MEYGMPNIEPRKSRVDDRRHIDRMPELARLDAEKRDASEAFAAKLRSPLGRKPEELAAGLRMAAQR